MEPKQKIFNILNQADDVVSGETLSAELGISRVSVWKHIKGIVQSGIPIVSSSKGYHLPRDHDSLQPWAFDSWQDRICYFAETTSTMDEAMALARMGCPDFTVAVAQRQTHGRGRMKRAWLSADGGLYFTVVVRPEIPTMQAGLVNLAAAIDMADLLRSSYRVDAQLKWPNDILVRNHKICGVLSQMEAEGDQVAHMNIGVGLNVNNAPETEEPIAISLKTLMGRPVPRREILVAFLDAFRRRILTFDPHAVIEQWRSRNVTLGQKVRVVTVKDMVDGTAVDVDPHGGLILQRTDGSRQTVIHGDCFHH
jgi:BirA family transcriptional regulator, biotin operon repressor / biotin---[acetyl-CoA-carboxylase] ligase